MRTPLGQLVHLTEATEIIVIYASPFFFPEFASVQIPQDSEAGSVTLQQILQLAWEANLLREISPVFVEETLPQSLWDKFLRRQPRTRKIMTSPGKFLDHFAEVAALIGNSFPKVQKVIYCRRGTGKHESAILFWNERQEFVRDEKSQKFVLAETQVASSGS